MTRLSALFLALALGLCAPAAPLPRDRLPPNELTIKKQLHRSWREVLVQSHPLKGRLRVRHEPNELHAKRLSETNVAYWRWAKEDTTITDERVRIDTTKTPMRMDVIKEANPAALQPKSVVPLIFKFEGAKLVTAHTFAPVVWLRWNEASEYKERPKDFELRPGVEIAVLEPCEYLERYRPPEQVPTRP